MSAKGRAGTQAFGYLRTHTQFNEDDTQSVIRIESVDSAGARHSRIRISWHSYSIVRLGTHTANGVCQDSLYACMCVRMHGSSKCCMPRSWHAVCVEQMVYANILARIHHYPSHAPNTQQPDMHRIRNKLKR